MRFLVLVLALVEGGWFAFDGAHAFLTGDYVTPSSGPQAGQLGPWSHLVQAVGLAPRSSLVMGIHLGLGAAWIGAMVGWLLRTAWSARAMLTCAVLGLWYLPFGTVLSVVQIVLLWRLRRVPAESP